MLLQGFDADLRLSPCGESGLKCPQEQRRHVAEALSLPMRGEWIEIGQGPLPLVHGWSLPMRGEWIEIET